MKSDRELLVGWLDGNTKLAGASRASKLPDRPSDSMVGRTRMRTALSRFVLSATRPFQLSAAQKKVHVARYPFASPRPLCRYSFPLKDFGKLHHLSCSYSPLTKARCTQAPATTALLFVHASRSRRLPTILPADRARRNRRLSSFVWAAHAIRGAVS